jgi:hypothetical protein
MRWWESPAESLGDFLWCVCANGLILFAKKVWAGGVMQRPETVGCIERSEMHHAAMVVRRCISLRCAAFNAPYDSGSGMTAVDVAPPSPPAAREDKGGQLVRRLRPRLPSAAHHVFEDGELFGADGAAGVEAAGGDADFGAHAEFAAVCKLCRGVAHHDG